jgi:glycosyltransferase involved in cell wall biosynthesis
MKVVIVNLRYFISGGPERYMFNIMEVLESHGHQVFPFSIKHNLNETSQYDSYFLDQIGKGDEIYFDKYKKTNLKDIVKFIGRLFYSFEAKKKFSKLIRATHPDLIYILCYQNKISPSVIDSAKKFNIPVVIRISDFGMICAANTFYLSSSQEICQKCLSNGKYNLILNKCFHNSYAYSTSKFLSYQLHDLLRIYNRVDAFVTPSTFTKGKFIEYGIPEKKLFHIPTFFNSVQNKTTIEYGNFALYTGRIEPEKGLKTLIDAFIDTDYELKIIGFSSTNYEEYLKQYLSDKVHKISFIGKLDFMNIIPYLEQCCFTIVPSEWFDNLPNVILESFAYKKCVIATNLGSLKELVINEETGLLFEYKNSADLRKKVSELINERDRSKLFGENAFKKLSSNFSKESHYEKLIHLFNSLTEKSKKSNSEFSN